MHLHGYILTSQLHRFLCDNNTECDTQGVWTEEQQLRILERNTTNTMSFANVSSVITSGQISGYQEWLIPYMRVEMGKYASIMQRRDSTRKRIQETELLSTI